MMKFIYLFLFTFIFSFQAEAKKISLDCGAFYSYKGTNYRRVVESDDLNVDEEEFFSSVHDSVNYAKKNTHLIFPTCSVNISPFENENISLNVGGFYSKASKKFGAIEPKESLLNYIYGLDIKSIDYNYQGWGVHLGLNYDLYSLNKFVFYAGSKVYLMKEEIKTSLVEEDVISNDHYSMEEKNTLYHLSFLFGTRYYLTDQISLNLQIPIVLQLKRNSDYKNTDDIFFIGSEDETHSTSGEKISNLFLWPQASLNYTF